MIIIEEFYNNLYNPKSNLRVKNDKTLTLNVSTYNHF